MLMWDGSLIMEVAHGVKVDVAKKKNEGIDDAYLKHPYLKKRQVLSILHSARYLNSSSSLISDVERENKKNLILIFAEDWMNEVYCFPDGTTCPASKDNEQAVINAWMFHSAMAYANKNS